MENKEIRNLYDILSLSDEIELRKAYDELNLKTFKELITQIQHLTRSIDESILVAILDRNEKYIYVNDLYCNVSKYSREELIGEHRNIIKSHFHSEKFYSNLEKTIRDGHIWKGDIKHKTKDGYTFWVRASIIPQLDTHGQINQFISLSTVVDEIYESRRQAHSQLEELQRIEKQKDEFSAMIAHELKTPIIPIQGYVDLILNEHFGKINSKQKDVLDIVADSTKRLSDLVGDILVINKLELGQFEINSENVDMQEFLNNIRKIAIPYIKKTKIQLIVNLQKSWTVSFDSSRITQVLLNLIKNSIDFVPKDSGKIIVQAELEENGNTIFSVEDNGPGITKGEESKLFKKFYQSDTSLSREHGGTGIGLAICKGIVNSHGGKIWLDQKYETGARIKFSIPKTLEKENQEITSRVS